VIGAPGKAVHGAATPCPTGCGITTEATEITEKNSLSGSVYSVCSVVNFKPTHYPEHTEPDRAVSPGDPGGLAAAPPGQAPWATDPKSGGGGCEP
jgi:hypothetical protein